MKRFSSISGAIVAALGLLLITGGCEDDPILQPTQGTTSGSGGSYGRIDFAPRDSNRADKAVPPPRMTNPATNPELF